jgi:putative transcriptional regulator
MRAANSMTQAELAALIGVTRQTVNAIEQQKYSPSLEVAFLIAHAFACPLEEVFAHPGPDR